MSRFLQAFKSLPAFQPPPHLTPLDLGTQYLIYLSAFIIAASVAYKFRIKSADEEKGLVPEVKRDHFVATLSMTAAVLLMFIFMNNRWLPFTIEGPLKWCCYCAGLFLVISGAAWHIWSKVSIGRFWSDQVELQKEHRLVTTGAYALARHPMYGSLIVWCLGLGLASFNLGVLSLTGFVLLPMMIKRAGAEEELLSNGEYEIYRNNVRMFFPSLSGPAGFSVKIFALFCFVYAIITGMTWGALFFLLTLHLLLGNSLKPEKAAFSYRSKSGMMLVIYLLSFNWGGFYYLYYLVAAMFAYGLFFNCPCMLVYEKYHGCPCFALLGKACDIKK